MLSAPELLKALVRFPSLSYKEEAVASFVEAYTTKSGLPTRRLGNNVYFWVGSGEHRLLLNSHLDVVPPSSGHPYDPFEPVEAGGLIYGRGTADAKASGAAMTTALLTLAREGWEPEGGQVIVALTVCEETGAEDNGLHVLRPHLPPIHAALVGEPTLLQPVIAQKGLLILKATVHGKNAHAARSHLGVNAISKAAEDICKLNSFRFACADTFLGAPTLCVTTISGGTGRNVVPDECTFYVDIRSVPGCSHKEMIQDIAALVSSDISVHSSRIIPVSTPASAHIVQSCLRVLPDMQPVGSPTASDWIHLHDLPVVKIGPGRSELSHTAEEHVAADEVSHAAQIYQRIIQEYFRSLPETSAT